MTIGIDWRSFDAIFHEARRLWPNSVNLSSMRQNGVKMGFSANEYDEAIGSPYLQRKDAKHIVRHMSWAILCALPQDFDGEFKIDDIDRHSVKRKFDSSVLHDINDGDVDDEELAYYEANLKRS